MDGARTPSNNSGIAPWRSTFMSSIESAPAAIPATRQPIFASASTPAFPLTWTCSRIRAATPALSARPITGTSPARDTRFGSSKHAEIFGGSCDNRIWQVSFGPGSWKLRNSHRPSSEDTFLLPRRACTYLRGGSRLRARAYPPLSQARFWVSSL